MNGKTSIDPWKDPRGPGQRVFFYLQAFCLNCDLRCRHGDREGNLPAGRTGHCAAGFQFVSAVERLANATICRFCQRDGVPVGRIFGGTPFPRMRYLRTGIANYSVCSARSALTEGSNSLGISMNACV